MDSHTRETLERITRTGKTENVNVAFLGDGTFEALPATGEGNMRIAQLRMISRRR